MQQLRLSLAQDSVVVHSSSKNWVAAGKVTSSADNASDGAAYSERVAAKLSRERDELWREFMILRSLGCSAAAAFVVSATSFFEPECIEGLHAYGCSNGACYALALEKGAYDLAQFLRECRLGEDEKRALVRELLDIVASINEAGFVWNDVKPGNFVFVRRENKWKAIDMESVNAVGSPLQASNCVTIRYAAPEIARACVDRNVQNLRAEPSMDAWSLGMTLLCIFGEHGCNYFEKQNLDRTSDIIRHLTSEKCEAFLDRYIQKHVPEHTYSLEKQVIRRLLRTDTQSRQTAAEIVKWLRPQQALLE